jgi:hypothetical protein
VREREREGEREGGDIYIYIYIYRERERERERDLSMHDCHLNKISDSYTSLQNIYFFYLSIPALMADLGEGECRNLHAMSNNNY